MFVQINQVNGDGL